MKLTRWNRTEPDPDSVLAAAAKASRGEPLTPQEEILLGRRIPGGVDRMTEQPPEPGLERIKITPPGSAPSDVEHHITQHGGEWVQPQAAALIPPDVRGVITAVKRPDMRDPHIPGVTYWLYRWWGRDKTTGDLYLLYVGETSQRPADRLVQHLTDPTAPAYHFKHLLYAWEVDPRIFPSKKAVRKAEDRAVKKEWPAQNTQLQTADNTRLWSRRDPRPIVKVAPWLTRDRLWTLTAILTPTITVWVCAWWANLLNLDHPTRTGIILAVPLILSTWLTALARTGRRTPTPRAHRHPKKPPAKPSRAPRRGTRR